MLVVKLKSEVTRTDGRKEKPTLGSAFKRRLLPAATLHSVGQVCAFSDFRETEAQKGEKLRGTHQMLSPQSWRRLEG